MARKWDLVWQEFECEGAAKPSVRATASHSEMTPPLLLLPYCSQEVPLQFPKFPFNITFLKRTTVVEGAQLFPY